MGLNLKSALYMRRFFFDLFYYVPIYKPTHKVNKYLKKNGIIQLTALSGFKPYILNLFLLWPYHCHQLKKQF